MTKAPISLSALVTMVFLIGCGSGADKTGQQGFDLSLNNAITQDIQERELAGLLEKKATINLSEYEIFIPEIISVSNDGSIAIIDYSQRKFNLINPGENFSEINHSVLPIREGRGPGEFANPVDLLFTADNELLTADPRNAKLIYYTLDGQLIREKKLSETPHRIAKANDRLVFAHLLRENLFSSVDPSTGEIIKTFGNLPTMAPILQQGDLSAYGDKIVFMPYGSSWFALFTNRGELLYQKSTIQPVHQSDDALRQLQDKPTIRPHNFKFINSSVQLLDDIVVILHSGDSLRNISTTIDVYSSANGKYLGTYTLDAPANLIRIQGNTLYTRSRNSKGDFVINIYDFQPRQLFALINGQ